MTVAEVIKKMETLDPKMLVGVWDEIEYRPAAGIEEEVLIEDDKLGVGIF